MITFLQNKLRPIPASRPIPIPRPTRPLPPPPSPLVRFRPDRPRQPELLMQLQERNPQSTGPKPVRSRQPPALKPYQLKPKRGQETFIEPPVERKERPPLNAKQIKCMKKKLGKLNKKIRHFKKEHDNLIPKRNSIKKKIEELKGPREPEESRKLEESFNPVEFEQAFDRAYRSYRINGRSRIDVDIRQNLIDLSKGTNECTD